MNKAFGADVYEFYFNAKNTSQQIRCTVKQCKYKVLVASENTNDTAEARSLQIDKSILAMHNLDMH